ncbi:MAG: 4Fe-4S double cluster binding domain-containing protein [Candidatus Hodarchaeales archaeon]
MNPERLKEKILVWGASIVGFADLKNLLPEKWQSLSSGISIAARLSDTIIDEIAGGPTLLYAHHYRVLNAFLDSITLKTTHYLQSKGFQGMPIPASQIVYSENLEGAISHKMVATRSGLGWIGKNALLITPQYGPRIRLATILTDAPLGSAQPITTSSCGKCRACVVKCPVKAIQGANWSIESHRVDLLAADRCYEKIQQNQVLVGEPICGICVSVCPIGKSPLSRKEG